MIECRLGKNPIIRLEYVLKLQNAFVVSQSRTCYMKKSAQREVKQRKKMGKIKLNAGVRTDSTCNTGTGLQKQG